MVQKLLKGPSKNTIQNPSTKYPAFQGRDGRRDANTSSDEDQMLRHGVRRAVLATGLQQGTKFTYRRRRKSLTNSDKLFEIAKHQWETDKETRKGPN